jgi:hypothetical protein
MDNQEVVSQETLHSQVSSEQVNSPQETQVEAPKVEEAQKTIHEKIGEVAKAAKNKASIKSDTQTTQQPAFVPNYKFKALDKEHEIPESLRAAIKDAETEKQVRELMLKSIGMDHIKPKYQEIRQKYEEVNNSYTELNNNIEKLRGFYQKGDLDSFFQMLNVPEEKILQYAVQKVQYKELPQEQQQIIAARRDAELRAQSLEQQNQQLSEQAMTQAVEAKKWALQMVMQRPDISSFAEAYDKAKGKPGSFQEVVVRTGEAAYYTRQKDLSPEEAVKEAMDLIGPIAQASVAPNVVQQPVVQAQQAPAKPPVIPNVQGRASTSPTKKSYTSVDDLKKHYKEKYVR